MRIAVVTFMFPAWSETFVRREVAALRDLGHAVSVFRCRQPDGPAVPGLEDVAVHPVSEEAVRTFDPDVIFGQMGYRSHEAAVPIAKSLGVPLVLRLWSGLDSFGLPAQFFPLYEGLSKDCRGIIVEDSFMSEWTAATLRPRCPIWVVPNSLEIDRYGGARKPQHNVALSIARFVPKKGLIHLVRAMRGLPDVELWLVGDGPERPKLEREAGSNARFLGIMAEDALPGLYAAAGMYVAPCVRLASGDADGIPTTALEALAAGCPVIASDLLSASCYVQFPRGGLLVPPGDERALAGAIRRLVDEPALASVIGTAGRLWAREHLDIERNSRKVEAILKGTA